MKRSLYSLNLQRHHQEKACSREARRVRLAQGSAPTFEAHTSDQAVHRFKKRSMTDLFSVCAPFTFSPTRQYDRSSARRLQHHPVSPVQAFEQMSMECSCNFPSDLSRERVKGPPKCPSKLGHPSSSAPPWPYVARTKQNQT